LGEEFVTKKKSSVSFLSMNSDDNYEEFENKPTYKFTPSSSWTIDSFKSVYE
jgi:hypothetical protein